jgi:membrane protease YdiL (CAAX protease family)
MFDPVFDPVPPPVEAPPAIRPAERLGALAEVLICSGFPTQIVIITLMSAFGMRLQTAEGNWSPVFVATLSLLDAVLVIGLVFAFLRAHGERAGAVLLGNRRVWPEILAGMALLPLVFLLAAVVLAIIITLVPWLHNVAENPMQDLMRNPRDAAIFGVVVMVAGGVREEIQRGFILHRFGQYLGGGAVGVVIHSVLFGLGHVDQGWDAAIAVGTLGAIWGTIYLIRRSIIAPMVSHAGFNLAQLIKFMALQ